MAGKSNPETWALARSLFEAGKSFRDIEAETKIPYKTVCNRSKSEGWVKGTLAQVISNRIKAKVEFGTLNKAQQEIVEKISSDAVKQMEFLNSAAMVNVAEAMSLQCFEQNDFKARADTILKGKEAVFGKQPDTAIQINNNQQDDGRPKGLADFYK